MQLGTVNARQQAQPGVHRYKAIVTPPDDQGLRADFAETRAKIRELLRVGFQAFDEVIQMLPARQHIVEARCKQRVGQIAGIEDKDIHHLFQVFDGRLTVQAVQQLDAFRRHRRK